MTRGPGKDSTKNQVTSAENPPTISGRKRGGKGKKIAHSAILLASGGALVAAVYTAVNQMDRKMFDSGQNIVENVKGAGVDDPGVATILQQLKKDSQSTRAGYLQADKEQEKNRRQEFTGKVNQLDENLENTFNKLQNEGLGDLKDIKGDMKNIFNDLNYLIDEANETKTIKKFLGLKKKEVVTPQGDKDAQSKRLTAESKKAANLALSDLKTIVDLSDRVDRYVEEFSNAIKAGGENRIKKAQEDLEGVFSTFSASKGEFNKNIQKMIGLLNKAEGAYLESLKKEEGMGYQEKQGEKKEIKELSTLAERLKTTNARFGQFFATIASDIIRMRKTLSDDYKTDVTNAKNVRNSQINVKGQKKQPQGKGAKDTKPKNRN